MSHFYRALLCYFMLLPTLLATDPTTKPLVVYIHETLYSVHKERLERLCHFPVLLKPSSGSDLLAKTLLEKKAPRADVIVGLEGEQAFRQEVKGMAAVLPASLFKQLSVPFEWESDSFLPISYAYLAFLHEEDLGRLENDSLQGFF